METLGAMDKTVEFERIEAIVKSPVEFQKSSAAELQALLDSLRTNQPPSCNVRFHRRFDAVERVLIERIAQLREDQSARKARRSNIVAALVIRVLAEPLRVIGVLLLLAAVALIGQLL